LHMKTGGGRDHTLDDGGPAGLARCPISAETLPEMVAPKLKPSY